MTYLLSAIFIFTAAAAVFPQINLSSLYESYYDDNIFNNSSNVSDFINGLSLGAGFNMESGSNNVQLYYMNNLSYYRQNIYKSSVMHKFGLVDTYLFSDDENPLNVGVNYTMKKNRDYFVLYDFNVFSFYLNYFHRYSENGGILAGYLFLRNRFENYSMFSHNENKIFLKYTGSFNTETSFILGIEFDNKRYLSSAEEYSGSGSVNQMKYYFYAARQMGENTGINAHFLLRKNLSRGTRFLTSGDLIYYEEEIFLDNYSNEGYEAGLEIYRRISSVFKGSFGLTYGTNNFLNLPAVDDSGYETDSYRKDKRFYLSAELNAELSHLIEGLYATLTWSSVINSSNDNFYKYANRVYSFSLGWEF